MSAAPDGPGLKARAAGMVVRIPLGDGTCGYARQLPDGVQVDFYDLRHPCDEPLDVAELRHVGTAFSVWVADEAFGRRSTWNVVGVLPATDLEVTALHRFFRQDAISGELSITEVSAASEREAERPASLSEVVGLERASVWHREHVEDRLRDHFADRPCRWIEPPQDPGIWDGTRP